jgi:hypothetical protein
MARELIAILLCATAIALHSAAIHPVAMFEITHSNFNEYISAPSTEYCKEIKDAVAELEKFLRNTDSRPTLQVQEALHKAISDPSTTEGHKRIYANLLVLSSPYEGCHKDLIDTFLSIRALDEFMPQDIHKYVFSHAKEKIKFCANEVSRRSAVPRYEAVVGFVNEVFQKALGKWKCDLPKALAGFRMSDDEFNAEAMLKAIKQGLGKDSKNKPLANLDKFMGWLGFQIQVFDPNMVNSYNIINLARFYHLEINFDQDWSLLVEYYRIWLAWKQPELRKAIEKNFTKQLPKSFLSRLTTSR